MIDLKILEQKLDKALSDTDGLIKYFESKRKPKKKLPFKYETTSFIGKQLKG